MTNKNTFIDEIYSYNTGRRRRRHRVRLVKSPRPATAIISWFQWKCVGGEKQSVGPLRSVCALFCAPVRLLCVFCLLQPEFKFARSAAAVLSGHQAHHTSKLWYYRQSSL